MSSNNVRSTILTSGLAVVCLLFSVAAEAKSVKITPAAENGRVRALVIGIDEYSGIPRLQGAFADAEDLNKALVAAGVSDVTMLPRDGKNAAVTRRDVETEMNRLLAQSKAGDLVFISFSGHASQFPELIKGSEVDKFDEAFLLSGFSITGAGATERIIDDEINRWLKQLVRNGVDVLLVADTNHGGGLLDANPKTDDLSRVTFLAAGDEAAMVPEVAIPGEPTTRGALSYAVARAIGRGGSGPVTRAEIFGYARELTYQYSETKQVIATEPGGSTNLDRVVFRRIVTEDGAQGSLSAGSEAGKVAGLVPAPSAAAQITGHLPGRRVALVIGNSSYKSMPVLSNPGNDAADVAGALKNLGFETIEASDLDRAGMNAAVDKFSRVVGRAHRHGLLCRARDAV